jgi:hypothetical protein
MFGLSLGDCIFVPSRSDIERRPVRAIVRHHILKPSHTPSEASDSKLRNVICVDVEQEVSPVVGDAMLTDEFDLGLEGLGHVVLEVLFGVVAKNRVRPDYDLRELVAHD